MATQNLFDKDKFYIIRADKAGMFMGKIDFVNGTQIGIRSLRRLYYWKGALDATQPLSVAFNMMLNSSTTGIAP